MFPGCSIYKNIKVKCIEEIKKDQLENGFDGEGDSGKITGRV